MKHPVYEQNKIRRDLNSISGPSTLKKKKDGYAINAIGVEETAAVTKQHDNPSFWGGSRGRGHSHASGDNNLLMNDAMLLFMNDAMLPFMNSKI